MHTQIWTALAWLTRSLMLQHKQAFAEHILLVLRFGADGIEHCTCDLSSAFVQSVLRLQMEQACAQAVLTQI